MNQMSLAMIGSAFLLTILMLSSPFTLSYWPYCIHEYWNWLHSFTGAVQILPFLDERRGVHFHIIPSFTAHLTVFQQKVSSLPENLFTVRLVDLRRKEYITRA